MPSIKVKNKKFVKFIYCSSCCKPLCSGKVCHGIPRVPSLHTLWNQTCKARKTRLGCTLFKVCLIQRRHLGTHRTVRPALQVTICQESLLVPGFKVRDDCSYPPTPCAQHNTGCGVTCSMPPRIWTGVPELNGVAFATTGSVWHMTQSPFGRLRCEMCIYTWESKRAGNGGKTGGFVWEKAGSEEGIFCTRATPLLHVCKNCLCRVNGIHYGWESLKKLAQVENLQLRDLRTYFNHILKTNYNFTSKEAGAYIGNNEVVNELH